MSHHTHNLPHPIAGGLLDRLTAEWDAHGWELADLHAFRMEDPPAPPPPPAPPADPPAPPATGATFTQADLDRIAAREKDEGRRAAERSLSEQLGCTVEEAKALIEAKRAEDLGKMSEADRKASEADAARAKAEKALADAEAREKAAEARQRLLDVTDALIEAGVRSDRRSAALKLTDVADDADEKALKAAVEETKKAYPEFFGAAPGAPSGVPNGKPPAGQGGEDDGAAAAEERYRKQREQSGMPADPFAGMHVVGSRP